VAVQEVRGVDHHAERAVAGLLVVAGGGVERDLTAAAAAATSSTGPTGPAAAACATAAARVVPGDLELRTLALGSRVFAGADLEAVGRARADHEEAVVGRGRRDPTLHQRDAGRVQVDGVSADGIGGKAAECGGAAVVDAAAAGRLPARTG